MVELIELSTRIVKVNVAPLLGTDDTLMFPPNFSHNLFVIASPNPAPDLFLFIDSMPLT